jgi:hypothetical protein
MQVSPFARKPAEPGMQQVQPPAKTEVKERP